MPLYIDFSQLGEGYLVLVSYRGWVFIIVALKMEGFIFGNSLCLSGVPKAYSGFPGTCVGWD